MSHYLLAFFAGLAPFLPIIVYLWWTDPGYKKKRLAKNKTCA